MATRSPPPARASMSRLPNCTSTIEETIASPNPQPLSDPVRSAPMRRNGSVSCLTSSWLEDRPAVFDDEAGRVAPPVVILAQPPGSLWLTALSTRFSTNRETRISLPVTHASGGSLVGYPEPHRRDGAGAALDRLAG